MKCFVHVTEADIARDSFSIMIAPKAALLSCIVCFYVPALSLQKMPLPISIIAHLTNSS